ncbi:MAG: GMC family oxidoreductase [Pseudomonadota bacterium]
MSHYDIIVIGSGFGSLFFLKHYLDTTEHSRVALVEWGDDRPPEQQRMDRRNSTIASTDCHQEIGSKAWRYTIGLGGGTNCWWGQTPRFLPNDFRMKSEYGVLEDWPFDYDALEPYYLHAEKIMQISGSDSISKVAPRSGAFPLPPHRLSTPDQIMMAAMPETYFPVATARASRATSTRNPCCASAVCGLCPVNAKFDAYNGFGDVFQNERVDLILNAQVREIDVQAGLARGVVFERGGKDQHITGDHIVLGANAIQSPAILLRSGLDLSPTGRGLCEQLSYDVEILLEGVDNFDGGTYTAAWHYGLYDGPHRRNAAATLVQVENHMKFGLRTEFGRWRQSLPLVLHIEDAPQTRNGVSLTASGEPLVRHVDHSDYAKAGFRHAMANLERAFAPLPIEEIVVHGQRETEYHLQCSLRMGTDPAQSVVDETGLHHQVRNIQVVGSAVFPTCPPANPSLTIAAVSLRSAHKLAGKGSECCV